MEPPVIPGLTTIIIPTYNHGRFLPTAIDSALNQTAPVEVLVVDDGSTDDTTDVLAGYGRRIRTFRIEHAGPSAARNRGIEEAHGEFISFLDADDVLEHHKVERQLAAMDASVGWVLCDVRIDDEAKARTVVASEQYDYAGKNLGGWIAPLLERANFIPIMSPLVRASAIAHVRFDDRRIPEDWHFWFAVAQVARVAYVPEVLATYRHRRTGRSRLPKAARQVDSNIVLPLRLNLGCGTPGTRSWHPITGVVNLDKSMGWTFEDGLPEFSDGSVAGITVSHALMYVPKERWSYVFGEFARVLAPGGVLRVTEDDAVSARSSRRGGWKGSQPAVTLTSAAIVMAAMEGAGLAAREVDAVTSAYPDESLLQAQHGEPPDVFFVEGTRVQGLLFSPHNDDESLFSAFTILRHRPHVVVCYPSVGDYGSPSVREDESRLAVGVLGGAGFEQWKGGDLVAQMRAIDERMKPSRVWAPDPRASHPDHVAVARAAREVFGGRLTTFHTYDSGGKVRDGRPVQFEPEWVYHKHRALIRYESQATHPRASVFFTWDLLEYEGLPGENE
jgi:hypothetical protein